jgi:membrane fusion protein (multidrug efflux system)
MQEKEQIQQLDVKQTLSKLEAAKAENERAEKAYSRAGTLSKENIASQSNLDTAKASYAQGKSQLELAIAAKEQSERTLKITRLEVERLAATVKAREADFKLAQIELDDTTVKAPVTGVIGQRAVKKGQLVKPGTILATLTNLEDIWVVANFKETQIANMAPGQKATVEVDGFSGRVFEGEVDHILPASGAEFSLLPPDNATGNFTKIVQRVPVRIKIANPHKVRLIPGLSVYASIKR